MEILGLILLTIIIGIFLPFIEFLGGWITGWLIKITIGPLIASGFALIGFYLPLNSFPLFFGTLAIVAGFFKTYNSNFNNKR